MPVRYQQFLDIVLGRARTLTFLDPETRQPDAAEVELAAFMAVLEINDGWDFDFYLVANENMAVTEQGVTAYPLPGNFGRLRVPRDENESGFFTNAGEFDATPYPLRYRDLEDWFRLKTVNQSRPYYFTISGDQLLIDPPPDTNGDLNYILQGTYIANPAILDGDDPLLVTHPTALIAATLARLALDKNASQAAALAAERNTALSKLVNNQARTRQQFRPRYISERGLSRWRRW